MVAFQSRISSAQRRRRGSEEQRRHGRTKLFHHGSLPVKPWPLRIASPQCRRIRRRNGTPTCMRTEAQRRHGSVIARNAVFGSSKESAGEAIQEARVKRSATPARREKLGPIPPIGPAGCIMGLAAAAVKKLGLSRQANPGELGDSAGHSPSGSPIARRYSASCDWTSSSSCHCIKGITALACCSSISAVCTS